MVLDMSQQPDQKQTTQRDKQATLSKFGSQIIPSMVLAPSAHNTQPWRFVSHHNHVDVLIDWDRHLDVSDPTTRQLFVSLGCALENGVIAAQHWGYQAKVDYFPKGDEKGRPVARITAIADNQSIKGIDQLFDAIEARRTNRHNYDEQPLSTQEKLALSHQSDHVVFVEDEHRLNKIAELSALATEKTLSRADFKQELSKWVRNSFTRRSDGMPGYAMGMPAPISLFSSLLVRIAPIHKQEAPKVKQQITTSSAAAVITSAEDNPAGWMDAGRLLERLWLEASKAGLAAAPLASAIEAGADIRSDLKQSLGTSEYPQAILRIGHSAKNHLQSTPRRSLADALA